MLTLRPTPVYIHPDVRAWMRKTARKPEDTKFHRVDLWRTARRTVVPVEEPFAQRHLLSLSQTLCALRGTLCPRLLDCFASAAISRLLMQQEGEAQTHAKKQERQQMARAQ